LDPPKGETPCRQLLAPAFLQLWPPSKALEVLSTLGLLLSSGWPAKKDFARHHTACSTAIFLHQACSLSPRLHNFRHHLSGFTLDQSDIVKLTAFASETPLHHAVRRDDLEVVQALLKAQRSFRLQSAGEEEHTRLSAAISCCSAGSRRSTPTTGHSPLSTGLRSRSGRLHTQTAPHRLWSSKEIHSTACSVPMESDRQDLIDLVHEFEDKQSPKLLTRAQPVCGNMSTNRFNLPHIGVSR
jgi:hypothetical protein